MSFSVELSFSPSLPISPAFEINKRESLAANKLHSNILRTPIGKGKFHLHLKLVPIPFRFFSSLSRGDLSSASAIYSTPNESDMQISFSLRLFSWRLSLLIFKLMTFKWYMPSSRCKYASLPAFFSRCSGSRSDDERWNNFFCSAFSFCGPRTAKRETNATSEQKHQFLLEIETSFCDFHLRHRLVEDETFQRSFTACVGGSVANIKF